MNPKIIIQHEYISLVLNKRRLTISYNGVKGSSGIPNHVFDLWYKAADRRNPDALRSLGLEPSDKLELLTIVKAFADNINRIWPEWSVEVNLPAIGSKVKVDMGRRKGIIEGEVIGLKRSYVVVRFPTEGVVSVQMDMIVP